MTDEERYARIDSAREEALNRSNEVYEDLLSRNSELARQQREYATTWQNTQNDIADKNANFQTELQNQNKEKAEREFKNEAIASKNAYYDFINPYGAQAEIQAQNGLNNSGYSETTKLGAWNTQQNRTAKARATMNEAKLQYDNAIKEIELTRDTTKAQYALEALKQQLDASLQEYSNASQLMQNQLSFNHSIDSDYNSRYDTLWSQINTEKQQKEAIRQYEQNYALQLQQFEEQKRQAQQEQANWEKQYQLSLQQSSGGGSSRSSSSGSSSKYATGTLEYGTLVDSYGDGNGNIIYTDSYGNTYKMKSGYNPYTGTKNSDVSKGTFSNGYQPNNVNGNKLSSVPEKEVSYNGQKQKIWTTDNEKYYMWDGTKNKYLKLNKAEKKALGL